MSGIFGWSYPPGCSGTPLDEQGAADLSAEVSALVGVPCYAHWVEDDNILACRESEITSSECNIPKIGTMEWDDTIGDAENFARAAGFIAGIITGDAS